MWSSLWRNLAETSSNSLRIKTPDNLTQAATCARTSGDVRSRCLAHSKVLCQILKQRHPLDFGVSGQKCWHERWCLGGRRRGKVVGHATCRHHVRAGGAAHELAAAAHVPQHLQHDRQQVSVPVFKQHPNQQGLRQGGRMCLSYVRQGEDKAPAANARGEYTQPNSHSAAGPVFLQTASARTCGPPPTSRV